MKRLNYFVNGGITTLVLVFMFVQCSGKAGQVAPVSLGEAVTTNLKFAYVEIDTLLTHYTFWKDLNEMMTKKEEDIRATLNQQGRELEQDAQDFQRKLENNAFVSRERAEQEQNRILKKQQSLQELQNRLSNELMVETQKNDMVLRDSINSFLKQYNITKGYSFIFTTATNFNNILYADDVFNITKEVVEGLNAKYITPKK
jgi:outer membrane protein